MNHASDGAGVRDIRSEPLPFLQKETTETKLLYRACQLLQFIADEVATLNRLMIAKDKPVVIDGAAVSPKRSGQRRGPQRSKRQ